MRNFEAQIDVNQYILDSINVEQAKKENKISLEQLGGVEGLIKALDINTSTGLTIDQVRSQRSRFGDNTFPEAPLETYIEMLIGALSDPVLFVSRRNCGKHKFVPAAT